MEPLPHFRSSNASVRHRSAIASLVLFAAVVSAACTGGHALVRRDIGGPLGIEWLGPEVTGDVQSLDRWRLSVGPPVVVAASIRPQPSNTVAIVSWNTALGAGDVPTLVGELRRSLEPGTPVILLLQEVYRAGPEVPAAALPAAAGFASRIRGFCSDGRRDEIESLAAALGMHAYYVPSMRNGAPLSSDEDRGNAILSDLPLSGFSAVELPFERQRRVAVSAVVTGADAERRPWQLRLMSVHLDNMVGAKRLWIAGGEYGRARPARGLLSSISADDNPVVVARDVKNLVGV
jgi:hypothetical protein